jgi:hypothetical protein
VSAVRLIRAGGVGILALLAVSALTASTAFAAAPWWHLTLGAAPTNLSGNAGGDEVQQLTINATKGDVLIANPENLFGTLTVVAHDASAIALQDAIETKLYPSRMVLVTGGAGKYVITFPDQSVPPIFVLPETEELAMSFGGEALEGEANLVELHKGAADENKILMIASNMGDAPVQGAAAPVTISDKLPAGLKAVAIEGQLASEHTFVQHTELECTVTPLECRFKGVLPPYAQLEVLVSVAVQPGTGLGESSEAVVSGGGAAAVVSSRAVPLESAGTFGMESYEMANEEEGGAADLRAGSHPFQTTSTVVFNQSSQPYRPPGLPKDVQVKLPAGLVGDPTAVPQCAGQQFYTSPRANADTNECPADTVVGVATVRIVEQYFFSLRPLVIVVPIFNLKPDVGEPARFGIYVLGDPSILDFAVRSGEDYGVTVNVQNIPERLNFLSSTLTLWGVPGDQRHDEARGWGCVDGGTWHEQFPESVPGCTLEHDAQPSPLTTLPTSCTGPLETSAVADSWQEPGKWDPPVIAPLPGLVGCESLPFEPSIEVAPETQEASTPAGLRVNVHLPQSASLAPAGQAESAVKKINIPLPAGLQLNPSAADGLQACTSPEIGYKGEGPQTHMQEFTSSLPEPLEPGVNFCPEASKIATVKIKTPLLPNALEGFAYLAAPQNFKNAPLENPFGSLLAMYIVARDPISGTLIKQAVQVTPNAETGQLTGTLEDVPPLPFEDAELQFFGTARAPLATPARCGSYSGEASLDPWSGNPSAAVTSPPFQIVTGPDGSGSGGCTVPRAFVPGFNAEAKNVQAGAFTPFDTTLTRRDQDQPLGRLEVQLPPGVSGMLSSVKLCGEPQAAQGSCGEESLIGHTIVSAGLGSDPYTVTGGKVYITTGYKGAPYGLSIVDPAVAGPFVLDEGRPVVVRAAVYVDPHTAAIKVVSDSLPTILDGIPLQIQHVNVSIDREHFTFNPTDCNKLQVGGTLFSSEGVAGVVSSPFQVTNCAALQFAPKFSVSTSAHTSKAGGASLTVKLSNPAVPQGSEANIAKVKVDLPKQLSTRASTLEKACRLAVFEANPAKCPPASIVGHATVHTPLIPVPLTGPAYLISRGGEAFPPLTIVLQGYGLTIETVGTTRVHNGITSTTFSTVPDVPFSTFELTLPKGKFSALAANGSLCKPKLTMPTAFAAQNGAEIHQSTPVTVTGCRKARRAKSAHRDASSRARRK